MRKNQKRLLSGVAALVMTASSTAAILQPKSIANAAYDYGNGNQVVEYLDRGITAVNTGSGMLVSWRFLANDNASASFILYRDGNQVYESGNTGATCYLDAGGSANSVYRVDTMVNGSLVSSDTCKHSSGSTYFDVPLDQPTSSSCTYSPNDCSVGDVDGDGEYELFVKWDPSNSKDNSQSGTTGNVYIDCYKFSGQKLWRVDLGVNIRAGAHYTQFLVADFDLDGYAEMACKTADGTKDGVGTVIGDGSKDYRNSSGYILSGNEYYTLFEGATGKALDTISYPFPRGTVSNWGDKYGNRVDRFLGTVAYLDGQKPSIVSVRGYYTRMTIAAMDVVNKKLTIKWTYDSGSDKSKGYGNGNHNCQPADVDNDGKQEIVLGGTCIDHDGKLLWCTQAGHGDAMHVGDLLPDKEGLEVYVCHEESPYGVSLHNAATGQQYFRLTASSDTGRCCADNIWAGNAGAEFWGNGNTVTDGSGNALSVNRPGINFLNYWDGDLEREVLDGGTDSPATIKKMDANGKLTTLLSTDGYYTCNTTKGTPCLSADIFGDWREEVIVRAADGKSVRVYSTPYSTEYRITTLMHDTQYRCQVATEQNCYNQPPHASFYLGTGYKLPSQPNVQVLAPGTVITIKDYNYNAFDQIEAEDFSSQSGVKTESCSDTNGGENVGYIENGDYLVFNSVGFGEGAKNFSVRITGNACTVSLYADSLDGTLLGTLNYEGSGSWTAWETKTINIADIANTHNLYIKITGGEGYLCNLNWFTFGTDRLPVNGTLVQNLICNDGANAADWTISYNAGVGTKIFGDRDFTYTTFPSELEGAEQILAACDSKYYSSSALASFTAGENISVYVITDTRLTAAPAWLSDWTLTNNTCTSSNDVSFQIYQKDFNSGETVTLGENGQSTLCVNYSVLVTEQKTTESNKIMWGDANCDNKTDTADLVLFNKMLKDTATLSAQGMLNVDVDGDAQVTSADIGKIMKFLTGLISYEELAP